VTIAARSALMPSDYQVLQQATEAIAVSHLCRVAEDSQGSKGEELKTSISGPSCFNSGHDSDLPTGPSRANKKLGARSKQKSRQLTE
jgi:hypothetical protein